MTPDPNPFPRISVVCWSSLLRFALFAASLSLLAYALFLTWGESPREPVVRAGSTSTPVVLNGDGRP